MATSTQKLAVFLAFLAAALSFAAVAVTYSRTGSIHVTPLGGGAVMLALGVSGYRRLNTPRRMTRAVSSQPAQKGRSACAHAPHS